MVDTLLGGYEEQHHEQAPMSQAVLQVGDDITVLAPGNDAQSFWVARVVDVRDVTKNKLKIKWYSGGDGSYIEYDGPNDTISSNNILGKTTNLRQSDEGTFLMSEDEVNYWVEIVNRTRKEIRKAPLDRGDAVDVRRIEQLNHDEEGYSYAISKAKRKSNRSRDKPTKSKQSRATKPKSHDDGIDEDSDWVGEGGNQGDEQMLDDDDPELERIARSRKITGHSNHPTSASVGSAAMAAMAGVRVSKRRNKGRQRGAES